MLAEIHTNIPCDINPITEESVRLAWSKRIIDTPHPKEIGHTVVRAADTEFAHNILYKARETWEKREELVLTFPEEKLNGRDPHEVIDLVYTIVAIDIEETEYFPVLHLFLLIDSYQDPDHYIHYKDNGFDWPIVG